MALIICLETSALACSVALCEGEALLAYRESEGEWRHSKEITLLIIDCLKEVGKTVQELSAVAISKGPGSYTGLRVGASCGKGLCYALDIPLLAIPTLELVAFPLLEDLDDNTLIVPLIDARRDEVYYNLYDKQLQEQQETTNLVLNTDSFDHFMPYSLIFCGDGAGKAIDLINYSKAEFRPSYASAKNMCSLANKRMEARKHEDLAYFSPFYLKPPNITKSTKALF